MQEMNLIFLKKISGIGDKRFAFINHVIGENNMRLSDIIAMPPLELKMLFDLPINVAEALSLALKNHIINPVGDSINNNLLIGKNFQQIVLNSTQYPKRLSQILGENAPSILHMWGNLDLLNMPSLGFCGSRKVSETGLQVTADIAQQAIELGWVVISGHAKGVDTTAHLTALENGGNTIIVIAEGIEKFKLRQEIKRIAKPENILIISEFSPQASWNVGYAMQRNKTIVALSHAMMLIESRTEGGTFDAGKQALRLNIPLFVAEYASQTNDNAGNAYFLKCGAKRVLKNKDTNRANILELKTIFDSKNSLPSTLNVIQMPLFEDIILVDKK